MGIAGVEPIYYFPEQNQLTSLISNDRKNCVQTFLSAYTLLLKLYLSQLLRYKYILAIKTN